MLEFPRDDVSAGGVAWALVTPGQDARANLAGQPQTLYPTGGPFWALTLSDLFTRGRDGVLALRRFKMQLGNGETPVVIRPCDCPQVPASPAGATIVATIAAASLRTVNVHLTMTSGARALRAGDQFSIIHPTWGERMYRIIDIAGLANSPPTVRIRPPLREAVSGGTSVNFNTPGCVMRLDGALNMERASTRPTGPWTGQARFVELERPLA